MTRPLVAFPLEHADGDVVVEIFEADAAGVGLATTGEVAARAARTFEEALAAVRPAVVAVVEKLGNLDARPKELTVEFGLKLGFKAGVAVIAAGGGEAHFKVAITWRPQQ